VENPKGIQHSGKDSGAIKCEYDGSNSRAGLSSQLSEPFIVTTGVLQGDTLALFLFVIILGYVLQRVPIQPCYTTHEDPRIDLCDYNFAKNISLLDDLADGARDHLVALAEGASRVSFRINMDKTQCMAKPALP